MKDQIGQLFFIGVSGTELSKEEADFIVKNDIGGVILFDRNIESPKQLHALCQQIQACGQKTKDQVPLFIGVDNEGGRVQRLKAPFTQWPAMRKLGDLDSSSLAFKTALLMSHEMRAIGINVDFAPCVDVFTNPQNTVIGDRALATDAEHVAKMGSALVRGFIKGEMIPCAKHFPGHGNTLLDSHEDLPVEKEVSLEDLKNRELIPFKRVFRARLEMVMTAHIQFPKIDPDWPVTLSEKFLSDIIRKDYRYRNLIISDDLDMKALTKNYDKETIAVQALKAGCDLLLYCNEPDSPPLALDAVRQAIEKGDLNTEQLQESYNKVVELKKKRLLDPLPKPLEEVQNILGHPDHLRLAKAITEGEIPEDLMTT